jgi:hypothetical protein
MNFMPKRGKPSELEDKIINESEIDRFRMSVL